MSKGRSPRFSQENLQAAWDAIASGGSLEKQASLRGTTAASLAKSMGLVGLPVLKAKMEYTQRRYAEAKELVRGGSTVKGAALKMHISPAYLSEHCQDIDLGKAHRNKRRGNRREWKMVTLKRVYAAMAVGSTLKEQAALLGVRTGSLREAMSHVGLRPQDAINAWVATKTERAVALIKKGSTARAAAEKCGLSESYIYRVVQGQGLVHRSHRGVHPRTFPVETLRQVYLLRMDGKSRKEVAEALGLNVDQVTWCKTKYGKILHGKIR